MEKPTNPLLIDKKEVIAYAIEKHFTDYTVSLIMECDEKSKIDMLLSLCNEGVLDENSAVYILLTD